MPSPYKGWPVMARAIARFRTAGDAGIAGPTLFPSVLIDAENGGFLDAKIAPAAYALSIK